jgi:Uma2 family endonuclease
MEETLIRPPRTIMEVFKMLPETTLAEVIDNQLYMSPSPVGRHQRIILNLASSLSYFVNEQQLGEVFISPFDVFLDEISNAVQPDILFIANDNLNIVSDDGVVHGTPDLIIEVLSPGNPEHDTVIKKALYERYKVKEYWIIDPKSKKATGYTLSVNRYILISEQIGSINSALFKKSFSF